MTRIIQNHRCTLRKQPFGSGWEVRVETLGGELVGAADPFTGGVPFSAWRRDELFRQVAKALIRAKEQELVK